MDISGVSGQKKRIWAVGIGLLVLVITAFEYWSGAEMEFAVIYLIPVLLAATINRNFGLAISVICAALALLADYLVGRHYSIPVYYLWDFGSHATIFCLATLLRSDLLESRQREHEVALTDPLTGALNRRAFYESAQSEIDRAQRYQRPLTIAYFDVDNFKMVNDTSGHKEGDRLLCAIVSLFRSRARKTDILARLGGDEFAMLMPETKQADALPAIRQILAFLADEVRANHWPVTFSVGVLTMLDIPSSVDQMIEAADALMYEAKHAGKNDIRFGIYGG